MRSKLYELEYRVPNRSYAYDARAQKLGALSDGARQPQSVNGGADRNPSTGEAGHQIELMSH